MSVADAEFSEPADLADYLRRAAARPHLIEVEVEAGQWRWRDLAPRSDWQAAGTADPDQSRPPHDTVILFRQEDHDALPPALALMVERMYADGAIIVSAGGAERGALAAPVLLSGKLNEGRGGGARTISVRVHDRQVSEQLAREPADAKKPLAIVSAFNERDVIAEVLQHLMAEGCEVLLLDNWSTDGTFETATALADANAALRVERFPAEQKAERGDWAAILQRKQEIAAAHRGRWILHTDADEIRHSPFAGVSLARALAAAEACGCNRVDFTVMNFQPTEESEFRTSLEGDFRFFQFGAHPSHFQQKKCWLSGPAEAVLETTGGHTADFAGARDFPYKFVLQHYPLRSAAHGRRKILEERRGRWSASDKARGWHTHYDEVEDKSAFLWRSSDLLSFGGPGDPAYTLVTASDLVLTRMLRGDILAAPMIGDDLAPAELRTALLKTRAQSVALQVKLHDVHVKLHELNGKLIEARQGAAPETPGVRPQKALTGQLPIPAPETAPPAAPAAGGEASQGSMRGVLDIVHRNRVQGWAIDGPKAANVTVWLGGEKVGTTVPNRMRPDVAKAHGAEALCGFDYFLPRSMAPGEVIRVTLPNGRDVEKSPSVPFAVPPVDPSVLPSVPVCENWGTSRGVPVDRYYIDAFLRRHAYDIRGHVLEVGDRNYTRLHGGDRVERSDILDIDRKNPDATIIADLTDAPDLPSDSYDCIVLTQVLCLIMEPAKAIATLQRILKPGGVLLVTVPGMSPVSAWAPEAAIWNWSFYPNSLRWLFSGAGFDDRKLAVEGWGNLKSTLAFMTGLAQEDLTEKDLAAGDPRYPLVVTARAVKPS